MKKVQIIVNELPEYRLYIPEDGDDSGILVEETLYQYYVECRDRWDHVQELIESLKKP